jgi:hypothetical protein
MDGSAQDGAIGMTRNTTTTQMIERLYGALACTSAVAILGMGGMFISLAIRRTIMTEMWQIILACMVVPILAAAAWSCGNYRENARVRAITSALFVPIGIANPLMWVCMLAILLRRSPRPPVQFARSHRPRPLPNGRNVRPMYRPVELHIEDRHR